MDPIGSVPAPTEEPSSENKAKNILLWALQILGSVVFSLVGVSKIDGTEGQIRLFDAIGFGQWFRYFTGSVEIAGALTLLFPSTVRVGALLLMGVMAGAAAAHVAILGISPALPLGLMVLLAIILLGRRKRTVGHNV